MNLKASVFFLFSCLVWCQAGENLIPNGDAAGGVSPIPGLEFNAAGPQGAKCFAVPKPRKMYMGKELIKIDPDGEYEFSAEICSGGDRDNYAFIGLALYDSKKRLISHSSLDYVSGSEAVTAAPVKKGDKSMLLKNAGDWETFMKKGARIIAMNANPDYSDLPNFDRCYTLTKIIRKDGLAEVQFSVPATKAYPEGTSVRLHRDGGYHWCLMEFGKIPPEWKTVSSRISGMAVRGVPKNQFWKTACYAKLVVEAVKRPTLFIRKISLVKVEKIPEGTVKAEARLVPRPGATLIATPAAVWQGRKFAQKADGSIIIEAESPWEFTPARLNIPSVCSEPGCGGGRYLQHSKHAVYPLTVTQPGTFLVYYRQRVPLAGEWTHSTVLDGKASRVTDCFPSEFEKYNRWNWHQAGKLELSAGAHTLAMDFQGGAMLDQIAIVPEGSAAAPKKNEVLTPEYLSEGLKGQAIFSGYMAGPGRSAASLSYQVNGTGKTTVSVSFDGGKNWKKKTPGGVLPEFGTDTPVLVKVEMESPDSRAFPLIENLKVSYLVSTELPPEKSRLDASMTAVREKVRLVPVKWTGARWNADGKLGFSRPLTQNADGAIYARITDADNTVLSPAERSWFEKDEKLGGATVLHQGRLNSNLIAYDFKLKKSGKFRPYFLMRLTLPTPDIIMEFNRPERVVVKYCYSVDRKDEIVENVGPGFKYPYAAMYNRKYYWFPGRPIELSAGGHCLRLRWGMYYMNCAAVALIPEEKPGRQLDPVMPETSAREASKLASVDYAEITGKLKTVQAPAGSRFEISYDSGKTFMPMPSLPMRETKSFMLRGYFRGAGKIPEIQAELEPSKVIALRNPDQKMTFDLATGNLTGYFLADGSPILPESSSQALFSFQIGSAKNGYRLIRPEPGDLVERICRKENGKEVLELRYALCDKKVETLVRVTLEKDSLPRWELSLNNRSGEDVRNVEFPSFRDVRLTGEPENVFYTAIRNLCAFGFTGAPLGIRENGSAGTWPGSYAMGYSAIYAKGIGSFTMQNRNPDGIGVRFLLRPSAGNSTVDMSTTRRFMVEAGKKADFRYAAGFFKGDEHAVCDLYGKWARSWMDFSLVNCPQVKNVTACNCGSYYPLDRIENQMIPIFRWLGYDMHWHRWAAVTYTHLFSPSYGTHEEIRAQYRALEAAGQPAVQYWDHYGWSLKFETDPLLGGYPREKLEFIETLAKPGMAEKGGNRSEHGNLCPWNYAQPDCTMCTDNHTWTDYARFIMRDFLIGKYGLSGVYADETCVYAECYNTAHDHGKQYGTKMVGLGKLLAGVIRSARKKGISGFITGEGSPDYLLQFEELGLRSGPDALDGAPLLFALPKVKFFRGESNHPNKDGLPNWDEAVRDYHLIARSDLPPYARIARHFTLHRGRIRDWMYNGVFRDNVGLRISQPGVIAKYFVRQDKEHHGLLLNLRNEHLKTGVRLELDKKLFAGAELPPAALAFLMEEERTEPVPLEVLADSVCLTVPVSRASSILIPLRIPERENVRADFVWPQIKGRDVLRLYLMNFSRKKQTVPLKIELPKGLSVKDLPKQAVLDPGQFVSLEMPLENRNSLQEHAYAVLTAGKQKLRIMLAPNLSNTSFEQHTGKTMAADYWGVSSRYFEHAMKQMDASKLNKPALGGILDDRDPYQGRYSLRLPGHSEPLPFPKILAGPYGRFDYPKKPVKLPWYYNAQQDAILKPGTKYRLTFAVRFAADDGQLRVQPYPYTERQRQISLTFAPKLCKPAAGDRKWQVVQVDFATKDALFNATQTPISFVNLGPSDLWIDAVSLTEVK